MVNVAQKERLIWLHREIQRLHEESFSLIPLKEKEPSVRFADRSRLPVEIVLKRMEKERSQTYGVRLDGLVVIDIDDDASGESLLAEMQNRFGPCGVIVRTSRGYHLYYLHRGWPLPDLRSEGLNVDVKSGPNQYVVGPGSVRPDGAVYDPIKGQLSWDDLTEIHGLSAPKEPATQRHRTGSSVKRSFDGLVPVGGRNNHLVSYGLTMIETTASYDVLYQNLIHERDDACQNPDSFPDKEVQKVTTWLWEKRCKNELYRNGRSAFRVRRDAYGLIKGDTAATALYVLLCDAHGHLPGKMFCLCHTGMKQSGVTDLGRRAFHTALKRLVEVGLLQVAKQHRAGCNKRQYRLSHPSPKAEIVIPINQNDNQ